MANEKLEDKPITLTEEDGSINLGGDPKAKRLTRVVTGKAQQVGLVVLFVMTIIVVAYVRTNGLIDGFVQEGPHWWDRIGTVHSTTESYNSDNKGLHNLILSSNWSQTTIHSPSETWSFRTEPKDAIIEARNPDVPDQVVRIEGSVTLPAWTKIQWHVAPDDRSETVRLIIEK